MQLLKVAVLAVGLLSVVKAEAAIIHKDWKSQGDQLVSYEQASNLDWLKLSATSGKTWRYVSEHLQTDFSGWRFPTYTEVRQMAERLLGKDTVSPAFNAGAIVDTSLAEEKLWFEMMGKSDTATGSIAYVLNERQQVFGVGLFPGSIFVNLQYGNTAVDGHAHTYFTGIYLVRDAVADVSAPTQVFGLALLLGGFLVRKRKQR